MKRKKRRKIQPINRPNPPPRAACFLLFALAMAAGSGKTEKIDGKMVEVKPPTLPMKILSYVLFALVILLILVGVLWVSQHFIYNTFGLDIFHNGGKG